MKISQKFVFAFSLVIITGCCKRPSMVRNAVTVTGDRLIKLTWSPNPESGTDFYRVYRCLSSSGYYELIAETPFEYFNDYAVYNGVTYFYALSAVNTCGEEGPLTDYLIYDTPRPQGFYASITDVSQNPATAGWDFSSYSRCDASSQVCDIYYEYTGSTGYIVCSDLSTDIQDMGWAYSFDDISYAPSGGWSPTGDAEAIVNHIYVIWTRTDNFAKIYVRQVTPTEIVFDWAYQTDPGNRELSIGLTDNNSVEIK